MAPNTARDLLDVETSIIKWMNSCEKVDSSTYKKLVHTALSEAEIAFTLDKRDESEIDAFLGVALVHTVCYLNSLNSDLSSAGLYCLQSSFAGSFDGAIFATDSMFEGRESSDDAQRMAVTVFCCARAHATRPITTCMLTGLKILRKSKEQQRV